jgi:hypothetical protein
MDTDASDAVNADAAETLRERLAVSPKPDMSFL